VLRFHAGFTADIPVDCVICHGKGVPIIIELCARRFFCSEKGCGQGIFTERLPNTVKRYGRRTCRLSTALEQITMALGGSAGSRLAEQLGILASGSTLLRALRKKVRAVVYVTPRVVGIDDWAWRWVSAMGLSCATSKEVR